MSLPSQMRFFDKDNNIIESIFINCGWFYEGRLSTLKVLKETFDKNISDYEVFPKLMYFEDKEIPREFDHVIIYEETFTFDEFKYLVDNLDVEYNKLLNEKRAVLKERSEQCKERIDKLISGEESIRMPIRKMMPELIAEQIVGVQPLHDKAEKTPFILKFTNEK